MSKVNNKSTRTTSMTGNANNWKGSESSDRCFEIFDFLNIKAINSVTALNIFTI